MTRWNGILCGLLGGLLLLAGCGGEVDPNLMLLDTRMSETRIDDLKKSMDFVRSQRQFEIEEFEERVTQGLNRWASYNPEPPEGFQWELDPLATSLVESVQDYPFAQRIDEVSFINTDAVYLQACAWSKLIASRMAAETSMDGFEFYRLAAEATDLAPGPGDPLAEIMVRLHEGMNEEEAGQLADVVRVFDWTARNIQLLPSPQLAEDEISEARLYEAESAAASGIPGLGYAHFPAQVLVYGRGDYAEKAKVFIQLVQQLGLDAVMLMVGDEGGDNSGTPWVVGVKVGEQLFLFDTRMGLPLPNHQTRGIATWGDVQADPSLLSWLDLSVEESLAEDPVYWVRPEQLSTVKARILASPESLSRRMARLEANFVSDEDPSLINHPSEIAARISEIGDLETAGIWSVAFDTHLYRQAVRRALNEAANNNRLRDKISWYFMDEAYIDNFWVYRTARTMFLHGKFNSTDRDELVGNAIERFFVLMYTDDAIRNLSTDERTQRRHGILKSRDQSPAEYQAALSAVQAQMRLIARDTSYFLAQCHFDNGNLGVASIWLERIRNRENAERWSDGIEYLLGRALEGNREYDRAIATYRGDDQSVQAHGNLIRARMLRSYVDQLSSRP